MRFTKEYDALTIENKFGCKATRTPFEDAFLVSGSLGEPNAGWTVQSLASMAIARICAEKLQNGKFLDCCAARGGKSVYVKQLCPDSDVVSCDVHPHRVELIKSYASRMNAVVDARLLDMTVLIPNSSGISTRFYATLRAAVSELLTAVRISNCFARAKIFRN